MTPPSPLNQRRPLSVKYNSRQRSNVSSTRRQVFVLHWIQWKRPCKGLPTVTSRTVACHLPLWFGLFAILLSPSCLPTLSFMKKWTMSSSPFGVGSGWRFQKVPCFSPLWPQSSLLVCWGFSSCEDQQILPAVVLHTSCTFESNVWQMSLLHIINCSSFFFSATIFTFLASIKNKVINITICLRVASSTSKTAAQPVHTHPA